MQAKLAFMARAQITPHQRLDQKREWIASLDFGGIAIGGDETMLRELGNAYLRTFEAAAEAEAEVDAIVQKLRRSGHTWTQIAAVLGVTRQAATEKFGG